MLISTWWCQRCQEDESSSSADASRHRWWRACDDNSSDVINRCRTWPERGWDLSQGAARDVHWYAAALHLLQQLQSSQTVCQFVLVLLFCSLVCCIMIILLYYISFFVYRTKKRMAITNGILCLLIPTSVPLPHSIIPTFYRFCLLFEMLLKFWLPFYILKFFVFVLCLICWLMSKPKLNDD